MKAVRDIEVPQLHPPSHCADEARSVVRSFVAEPHGPTWLHGCSPGGLPTVRAVIRRVTALRAAPAFAPGEQLPPDTARGTPAAGRTVRAWARPGRRRRHRSSRPAAAAAMSERLPGAEVR